MHRDSIRDGDRYGSLRYALYCLMPKGKARRLCTCEYIYRASLWMPLHPQVLDT